MSRDSRRVRDRRNTSGLFVGLATLDIAQLVDRYPDENSKNQAVDTFVGAGGPATNAAVAFAALAQRSATLVTVLGQHHLAATVRADLHAHHVNPIDSNPSTTDPPPVSSVVTARTNDSRTIVSLDGIKSEPSLAGASTIDLDDIGVVLADGHYAEIAVPIVSRAKGTGALVVVDAGRWKPSHADLVPLADVVICSADWSPPDLDERSDESILRFLHSNGARHAAITHGGSPITYSADIGADSGLVEVPDTPVVDTLGAGDIFHGAFCWSYLHGDNDVAASLRSAARVASLSCRHLGTRRWIADL